jgi:NAD(P)-dependent dehydrogenase (short-subunit alcohol dehydrogenase family)
MDAQRDLGSSVVLVAGASSGMGRATALLAAEAGATLVLAARSADALDDVAAAVKRRGARVQAIPTDATDREAVERLVRAAIDAHGRIDALVNTVGTNIPRRALDELTSESWSEMLAANLSAVFNLTQAVVPVLRKATASSSTFLPRPPRGQTARAWPIRPARQA